MPSLALIVGTRPECIKLAPVVAELRRGGKVTPLLVSTGQHRELLDQALGSFGLKPDIDLGLMTPGQSLPELSSRVITGVSAWLASAKPSAVLVQGDTTTVLGSALAAFYAGIPVGHVEAGLRTGDLRSPFPEEMNRRVSTTLARWHFCPTEQSRANLLREGVPPEQCHVTGNTVIDALLATRARIGGLEAAGVGSRLGIAPAFVASHLADPKARWVLVTGHRRESFGPGFENICRGLRRLIDAHPDLGLVYPVHLNPQVQEPVRRLLGDHPRIALAAPAAYDDFVWLMDRCAFVLTDSGGVQEEAPSLGKPVLVLRENTERPEGVDAGTSELVGTDPARMVAAATRLLTDPAEYARRSQLRNPYGDGSAAAKIARVMEAALSR
ncbi:MAG: UDP-N-acetylglucosamine 2-epimerase [Verrucomicrobiota bacterium]